MTPHLTVLVVNYNTSDFVALLLRALHCLTSTVPITVVADNGSRPRDVHRLIDTVQHFPQTYLYFRKSVGEPASLAHGRALDALMQFVMTPYVAVFDSDATVLRANWDQRLIERLDEQVKIIGTPLGDAWAGGKPTDFPLSFIVLLETDTFHRLRASWQPKFDEQGNVLIRNGIIHDTAWELRQRYRERGYRSSLLVPRNTRFHTDGPFSSLLGVEEFYLREDDPVIFASHFGRGATLGRAKYRGMYTLPFVGWPLASERGARDKRRWLAIARQLIDVASASP
jgi:glycosyl transferase family 2